MIKKLNLFFLCLIIIGMTCGCSKSNSNLSSEDLSELKELIESNKEAITELTKRNNDLENKIATLEEENKVLKESSSSLVEKVSVLEEDNKNLKESDTKINNSISSNYDELKKLINNKNYSSSNYAISKSDLIGTWRFGSSSITFTNENTEVFNNWIIFKNDEGESRTVYYMYKDGKLHITQFGGVFTK